MALLVVAVKIHYPFDTSERHLRLINDLGPLALDWDHWRSIQKTHDSRGVLDGKLGRGNEIRVKEADVFKLSGGQIDTYLDWFERTWIDEERARKNPRGYPEQLLDMFPTGRPVGSTAKAVNPQLEHEEDEEALEEKLRAVQGSLKPRQVISNDDIGKFDAKPVNRIGSYYKRCRKPEELSATEKAFHEAAADLIAIKLQSLLVAVTQIEDKLLAWRKRQLRETKDSDDDVEDTQREKEQGEHSERALTDEDVQMGADSSPPGGKPSIKTSDSDSDSLYEEDDPM
ncbi:MAG: hypothetical protein Q9211_005121 [Gyalolechia sp. 1 TL-2023]